MISFSMENIKYQRKDSFHKELTTLVEKMYANLKAKRFKTNKELMASEVGKELNNLIKKRFNLTVEVDPVLSDITFMAIVPFSSDMINQVNKLGFNVPKKLGPFKFWDEVYSRIDNVNKEAESTANSINGKNGTVDRGKAYVTGYLADVRHHLLLNIAVCMKTELKPAEVSAAIIHEIGHAFTGLENHYKMLSTNVAISKVMKQINGNDLEKAKYTFKSEFGPTEFEESGISTSENITDFYGNVAKMYIGKMESQYQSAYYDKTSFEFMSDEFVVAMGAGADLSTGLDKLMTLFTGGYNKMKYAAAFSFFYNYLILGLIGCMGPVGSVVATFLTVLNISASVSEAKTIPIYDNFRERHSRAGRNIINILKDPSLPKAEAALLVKQYEVIQTVVNASYDYEGWGSKFWMIFMPSIRKGRYYRKRQQKIENLLNSPIFVNVAKIKSTGE